MYTAKSIDKSGYAFVLLARSNESNSRRRGSIVATQCGAKPKGQILRAIWFAQKGQDFAEYDFIYVNNGMLFWGARNVDGSGFEKRENRPTNLQIPMVRN